jgi:pimeloyl-ACP methyl ester carboxylesterase
VPDVTTFHVPNGDGWQLFVKRTIDPNNFDPKKRPVALVPGFGMNSFILGFHPTGVSLEEFLAAAGFEVWSMNFRGQDHTINEGGARRYGWRDVTKVDLPAIVDFIMANTSSRRHKLDMIGCSLGGTYMFAYAALNPGNPLGNLVAMGAPLRWVEVHPLLRLAFSRPALLGLIDMRYTRALCRLALPVVARIPSLLHIYLHPEIIDMSQADKLVQTVEDPNPILNQEIARWVGEKDLTIDGVNISLALKDLTNPLFCIQANADGIVPQATAFSALELIGSKVKDSLLVGTAKVPMAHADMYISHYAQDWVFRPLAEWLAGHQ